jgi:K+/H+ antiporter YhaU regulatory subunit KhtT
MSKELKKGDVVYVNATKTKVERVFKYKETFRLSVTHMGKKLTFERFGPFAHDKGYRWDYTGESYGRGYKFETEEDFIFRTTFSRAVDETQKVAKLLTTAYKSKDLEMLKSLLEDVEAIVLAYKTPGEKK